MGDLCAQAQLTRLSASAKEWSAQTGASLRTAATHFGVPGATEQHANSLAASGRSPLAARSLDGASPTLAATGARSGVGLGHDQELEAYLRVR